MTDKQQNQLSPKQEFTSYFWQHIAKAMADDPGETQEVTTGVDEDGCVWVQFSPKTRDGK